MKTRSVTAAFLLLLISPGDGALADGERVAFVGCPVMRDMDLPERPCWLAQDGDKLYFLGMQGDIFPPVTFYPPQLKHQVLVEGEEAEGDKICGGLPLKHVKVSVLQELDLSCDTVLPKAGFSQGPVHRPSPPFRPGRALASDRSQPREAPRKRPPPPRPPFEPRTFRVPFAFEGDFIQLEEAIVMVSAVHYFEDIKASRMTVEVYRDRVELTNGRILEEAPDVAQRRAWLLMNNLTEWGVPEAMIEMQLNRQPAPGGRQVILTVHP